jgi:hypothetical protein
MSDLGESQCHGDRRFVVWCGLCDAAQVFWLELGARQDLATALDVAMTLYELGHALPHYLGVRVTGRDAQRPVYEKLVPDIWRPGSRWRSR